MQPTQKANIVICGAGIAGLSAAYFLAVRRGFSNIVIVDDRAPLTLTSDKSTEAYRNWWPGPGNAMVLFMNRSIDLLEELAVQCDNRFHLNRRGYIYLTADPRRAAAMKQKAMEISNLGAGPLRIGQAYTPAPPEGYIGQPSGADYVTGSSQIKASYPFLSEEVAALLHTRRCGWLSAQQLGMYLFDAIREAGVSLLNGRVTGIEQRNHRISGVLVQRQGKTMALATRNLILATGPYLKETGRLLDLDLPVYNELHGKIAFEDTLGIVPRDIPMMIWEDPVSLPWSPEEREELQTYDDTAWLLETFPAGLHFRPEGGPGSETLLALWPYHLKIYDEPIWPLQFEPEFTEVVLRGLSCMVPELAAYIGRMARPYIDGGYYTKTKENRPLICPLPVEGVYVFGALSGFGIMAALAGAELLAAYVTGSDLPDYAPAMHLDRYKDPEYQALLADWEPLAGQL